MLSQRSSQKYAYKQFIDNRAKALQSAARTALREHQRSLVHGSRRRVGVVVESGPPKQDTATSSSPHAVADIGKLAAPDPRAVTICTEDAFSCAEDSDDYRSSTYEDGDFDEDDMEHFAGYDYTDAADDAEDHQETCDDGDDGYEEGLFDRYTVLEVEEYEEAEEEYGDPDWGNANGFEEVLHTCIMGTFDFAVLNQKLYTWLQAVMSLRSNPAEAKYVLGAILNRVNVLLEPRVAAQDVHAVTWILELLGKAAVHMGYVGMSNLVRYELDAGITQPIQLMTRVLEGDNVDHMECVLKCLYNQRSCLVWAAFYWPGRLPHTLITNLPKIMVMSADVPTLQHYVSRILQVAFRCGMLAMRGTITGRTPKPPILPGLLYEAIHLLCAYSLTNPTIGPVLLKAFAAVVVGGNEDITCYLVRIGVWDQAKKCIEPQPGTFRDSFFVVYDGLVLITWFLIKLAPSDMLPTMAAQALQLVLDARAFTLDHFTPPESDEGDVDVVLVQSPSGGGLCENLCWLCHHIVSASQELFWSMEGAVQFVQLLCLVWRRHFANVEFDEVTQETACSARDLLLKTFANLVMVSSNEELDMLNESHLTMLVLQNEKEPKLQSAVQVLAQYFAK